MVTLDAPTSFTLFALASVMVSLSTIPVVLTKSAQPAPIAVARIRPRALYAASPVGIVGVTVVGVANGAFWSLVAVYAIGEGLDSRQVAIFTGLATIGGALAQWPAGRISDRVDRRIVLIVLLALAAAVGLALAFLPIADGLWIPLAVLFGVTTLPTYAVAAAHAYDHAPPGGYVATAAGLLLANGVGAIVGPLLAAGLMEATSTAMLFLFTAFAQSGLALFAIARMKTARGAGRRRRRPTSISPRRRRSAPSSRPSRSTRRTTSSWFRRRRRRAGRWTAAGMTTDRGATRPRDAAALRTAGLL